MAKAEQAAQENYKSLTKKINPLSLKGMGIIPEESNQSRTFDKYNKFKYSQTVSDTKIVAIHNASMISNADTTITPGMQEQDSIIESTI